MFYGIMWFDVRGMSRDRIYWLERRAGGRGSRARAAGGEEGPLRRRSPRGARPRPGQGCAGPAASFLEERCHLKEAAERDGHRLRSPLPTPAAAAPAPLRGPRSEPLGKRRSPPRLSPPALDLRAGEAARDIPTRRASSSSPDWAAAGAEPPLSRGKDVRELFGYSPEENSALCLSPLAIPAPWDHAPTG